MEAQFIDLRSGATIAEVMRWETVPGNLNIIHECGVKPDLLWHFKGPGIDGHFDLEADGRKVTPNYIGQTGSLTMDNGDIIDFVAVKKGER